MVVLTQVVQEHRVKVMREALALVQLTLPQVLAVVQLPQDKRLHLHQQLQQQAALVHLLIQLGAQQLLLVKMYQVRAGTQAAVVVVEAQLQHRAQVVMVVAQQAALMHLTLLLTHQPTQAVAAVDQVYSQSALVVTAALEL